MKPIPLRWLAPLMVSASGLAGYAVGIAGIPDDKSAGGAPEISTTGRRLTREPRAAENPLGNFKSFLTGSGRDTSLWKTISRLPAASIPEALRTLRQAQAVTSSGTKELKRLNEIESALYYRWAETDPVAAQADARTMPGPANGQKTALMKSVLTAWMRMDPITAYRSVKDQHDYGYMGRDMWVKTWTTENAFENLKLFPDQYRDLLGGYCGAVVHDEGQRDAMLDALKRQPDLRERDWGYERLFREWAQTDFPAAIAEAGNVDLPGFSERVLEDGVKEQPALALPWAASQNIPPNRKAWRDGYSRWLSSDAAAAKQWLEKQAPVWEAAGHFEAVAVFRIQELSKEEKINLQAARPVWTALISKWKSQDPEASEKWPNGEVARSQGIVLILSEKGADGNE